jgi:hypothetical protein
MEVAEYLTEDGRAPDIVNYDACSGGSLTETSGSSRIQPREIGFSLDRRSTRKEATKSGSPGQRLISTIMIQR